MKNKIYFILLVILCISSIYLYIQKVKLETQYVQYKRENNQLRNLLLKLKSQIVYLHSHEKLIPKISNYTTVSKDNIITLDEWNNMSQII